MSDNTIEPMVVGSLGTHLPFVHRAASFRDGAAIVVKIPVSFYRRNGRQMVLTRGDDGQTTPDRETNGSLVSALAKAYHWQEQLESGEYAGLEDLAAANGVDRTYVGRMLRLTSLAPGIVERILGGDEPEGVSLRRLWKNLPAIWVEQNWPGE
jgi:hypothetical protein